MANLQLHHFVIMELVEKKTTTQGYKKRKPMLQHNFRANKSESQILDASEPLLQYLFDLLEGSVAL